MRATGLASVGAAGCSLGPSADEGGCARVESPFTVCAAGPVVQGIDVSTYQGVVAWPDVKAAGISFAFARISDGATVLDGQFGANWRGMKSAGIVRGAYQYFRAGEDPEAEAAVVVTALRTAGGLLDGDLPVVMDVETADGQTNATVRGRMAKWLDAVSMATGRTPTIYTNPVTSSVIGAGFGAAALWVAHWGVTCPTVPSGWARWALWQYSDMAMVPGIRGPVDLDEFDGTPADLAAFASPAFRSDRDADSAGDARTATEGGPADEDGGDPGAGTGACLPATSPP
jgi:lysozyme